MCSFELQQGGPMQRLIVLLLAAILVTGTAFADPALGGGRGLFRVQDARVEEDGALVFANRWVFTYNDSIADNAFLRGPLYGLEMNYAPFPMLEIFGSMVGVFDWKFQAPDFFDWHGEALGAKLSVPYIPVLKVAASGHYNMTRTHEYDGFLDGFTTPGVSYRLIGSLRLWELYKTLPTLMFNYGEDVNDQDTGRHFLGGGIEFASNALDLFVEASSRTREGVGFFSRDAAASITPGVRIKIPYFHINGGIELGLTDNVPTYRGIAGFSIVSPFPKPPRKPFGRLAGKVQDARSGMPLAAKVSLSGARTGAVKTDAKTGVFYMQKVPTGVIVAEASKEGYIPEAVPLIITDQGYGTYTFNLKPLVPYGTVAGRVTDAYSGKPIEARVSFIATGVAPTASNAVTGFFRADNVPAGLVSVKVEKDGYFPEERVAEVEDGGVSKFNIALASLDMKGIFRGKVVDKKSGEAVAAAIIFTHSERPTIEPDKSGAFSAELPVGSYEVRVEASGYMPQTSAFAIAKGDTLNRAYEMVSKGMVLTLRGVYFEFGKATLRTESYPALAEAAQIMKDNPDIEVEIQGHTDNVGSDKSNQTLSEKRAYAVMSWLVQYGGVDAKRLTAKGYGETKPIASNDTEEGRQLNRRVDFVIVK
jgi:outer membrane protein OmpA-like peptidoglycan-associated protein